MIGTYARAVVATVERERFGPSAVLDEERDAVGLFRFAFESCRSVSIAVRGPGPFVTRTELGSMRRHGAVHVDLESESRDVVDHE